MYSLENSLDTLSRKYWRIQLQTHVDVFLFSKIIF